MSYHIYTTDGIVLKRSNFGEANIILYILTRDLGLIIASAQAARLGVSKLRPSLQEYSYATFSAIKGKNGWKLTNAISKQNFFFETPLFAQKFISQISTVLVRMMPGEEIHKEIFDVILSSFEFVKKIHEKDIQNFEILCMIRILYHLGYVSSDTYIEKFLESTKVWNQDLILEVKENKKILVEKINKGLKESQL